MKRKTVSVSQAELLKHAQDRNKLYSDAWNVGETYWSDRPRFAHDEQVAAPGDFYYDGQFDGEAFTVSVKVHTKTKGK